MYNHDTLFLDRDGVINKKLQGKYVCNFLDFEFMPGALKAISDLTNIFNRIIIVTNQQGIGKGIMTEADLNILHAKMSEKIKDSGGEINKIYYCPHLQVLDCLCRKPNPGMILQATVDFPEIIIDDSCLVGDSDTDILAARRMNLEAIKVDADYTLEKWTNELLQVL